LEKSLGKTLFTRRPFTLTQDGEELQRSIAPFFDGLDGLEARIKDGGVPLLSITAPPTLLRDHLPRVLDKMRGAFPELRLRIREANPGEALALLFTEQIDVAVSSRMEKAPKELYMQQLASLPLVLLVRADSPWKDVAQVIEEASRTPLTLISLPHRETLTQIFIQELRNRGVEWGAGIEVNSLQLIQSYVIMGFGIGLSVRVPGQSFPEELRVLSLDQFPPLEIGAFWRCALSPHACFFVKMLKQYVKEMGRGPVSPQMHSTDTK
jgi:DNA-binding transcriptional LysR family regulator